MHYKIRGYFMSKHCPKCHQSFSDLFEECVYCGSDLQEGEYVVYYDNTEVNGNSEKSMYLKIVYFDLESKPQSIELLCSNCKKVFEIDDNLDKLFSEITSETLVIRNDQQIKCTCGNIHPMNKITFQIVVPKVTSQPIKSTPNNTANLQINVPRCLTCQSTNIQKISALSKAGSVALWGILSQKVKKQWHCNNCGYEW